MDQKFDVVALGELLIDFTQNGSSGQGNPLLEANPGGAPCNVLAMLQKLGKSTAFVGKVGNDMFGRQLREVVEKAGIDLTNLVMDPAAHTTLAFVQTFANRRRGAGRYHCAVSHFPFRDPVYDPSRCAGGHQEGRSLRQERRRDGIL